MKNIIILILLLIILGLYFYTSETKAVLKTTGNSVIEKTKEVTNEIRQERQQEQSKSSIFIHPLT
ncbi:hypothetical protein HYT58_03010 [Candidatus Woesearchaeota archaeon]|nr:hypothetical protein [Candidatus Woesearchaeota archaeon]